MERNGLQKCTVLGYKNGIKRVTKMEWIGLQEFQKQLSAKRVNVSGMYFGYVPQNGKQIQMSLPDGFDCYQSTPSVSSSPANP